ncbi:MAG: tagatose-bisphosphate aldolase, partial [Candidatus Kerfeldbacteria bacterium CG08_land_8_20_14_0_20_42_7]
DPRRFVELTGVDFFAPAIGIMYKNNAVARVNIDTLRAVRRDIDGVPLVLRSCPKVPDRDIITSIRSGVAKVIVGSELQYAFSESLRHNLSDHASVYDPRGILGPAKDAVKAVVKEKIILFGSSGKA